MTKIWDEQEAKLEEAKNAYLKDKIERIVLWDSYHGVTLSQIITAIIGDNTYPLTRTDIEFAVSLCVDEDIIYLTGDTRDAEATYRATCWVDESESYCRDCGSPSHSNCLDR